MPFKNTFGITDVSIDVLTGPENNLNDSYFIIHDNKILLLKAANVFSTFKIKRSES